MWEGVYQPSVDLALGSFALTSLRSASVIDGAPEIKSRSAAAFEPTGVACWNSIKNVGGGLLPMAVGQLQIYQLTHPHREQAPSHI